MRRSHKSEEWRDRVSQDWREGEGMEAWRHGGMERLNEEDSRITSKRSPAMGRTWPSFGPLAAMVGWCQEPLGVENRRVLDVGCWRLRQGTGRGTEKDSGGQGRRHWLKGWQRGGGGAGGLDGRRVMGDDGRRSRAEDARAREVEVGIQS